MRLNIHPRTTRATQRSLACARGPTRGPRALCPLAQQPSETSVHHGRSAPNEPPSRADPIIGVVGEQRERNAGYVSLPKKPGNTTQLERLGEPIETHEGLAIAKRSVALETFRTIVRITP